MNRRQFLGTTRGSVGIAAPLSVSASAQSAQRINRPLPVKSLPIGVFDPPFNKLSMDEMLDKFASLGIEAVEVGAAGSQRIAALSSPGAGSGPGKGARLEEEV